MAILTLPATLKVRKFDFGQERFDLEFSSGDTGTSQVRVLAPPRWTCALVAPQWLRTTEAAVWRDLILRLQGRVNQLAVHDFDNEAPQGTMRGTLTLASAVAINATTLSITGGVGQAGTTLLAGDWIGIGSGSTRQVVSIAANATANGSGVIAVTIAQPSRWAQSSGSGVTWDKPTSLFRQRSLDSRWSREGDVRSGYSLDLIESWET